MRPGKICIVIISISLMINLTACQPTPKDEAIRQKGNLSEVIQENEMKVSQEKIGKLLKVNDQRSFALKSKNGLVNIKVVAKVIVPDVTKVSVYEVERNDFTEADIEKLHEVFFGDSELYPELFYEDMTKDELLAEISRVQEQYDKLSQEDTGNKDIINQKIGGTIDKLQSLIASAPETAERKPLKEYKLVEEKNQQIGDTHTFFAQGKIDSSIGHLSIQNGASFSEATFRKERPEDSGYITATDIETRNGKEAAEMENNCQYSETEAVELCNAVLKQLGVGNNYAVFSAEGVADVTSSGSNVDCYNGYLIKFSRIIDGVSETYDFYDGNMTEDGGQSALPYCFEKMYFIVRDDGIDYFDWNSPMILGTRQADHVKLADYNEIEETFRNQVLLNYSYVEEPTNIDIDEIRFGYMRAKEKDKDHEFTLVPVWDFIGELNERYSIMTINAIDGSIMNRQYGY